MRSLLLPRLIPRSCGRLGHTHTHTHRDTHTHSRNSGDLKTPHGEVTLLGLPRPFPFLPPAGCVVELWGHYCCPGMERGCTRQAGLGDGVCELGSRAGFPRFPRGQRSGPGRFRPRPLPPAEGQTRPLLLRGLLPPGPFLTSPTRALTICSLYFFPSPSSPNGRREIAPAFSPRTAPQFWPIGSCAPALPGFAEGSEPSAGRHSPWEAESASSQRRRSVFRAPLSYHGPLGCVVLPLAVRLREEARLGNQKTTDPCIPRDEGGRGTVLGFSGARGWEVGTNKGNCGEGFSLLRAGTLHMTHVLYLICTTTRRQALWYPSSFEGGRLLASDHKALLWKRWD